MRSTVMSAGGQRGDDLSVVCVLALTRQYRSHPIAPDLLDRRQDPRLVVDQDIMVRRIALFHILELLLLMDVDQHMAVDRFRNSGALDLTRLKDDIPIGQNGGRPPAAEALEGIERLRVQPVGEGIIDQVGRHRQQVNFPRPLGAIALQRTEVIAIAQFGEQILQDRPVPVTAGRPKFAFQMTLQIQLGCGRYPSSVLSTSTRNTVFSGVII